MASQEGSPSVSISRIPEGVERPKIDGRLEDPAWEAAKEVGELLQVEPVAGAQGSERTRIRLLYDERSIFLAIECFDSNPEGIRATQAKRDANLDPDDRVEWLFDPFLDSRNAFWFQIGAAGSLGDALITRNGSQFNKQWDTIWYGESRIDSEGWFAEVEIPTASINFDPEAATWGFNVRRLLRRRNEELRWASPSPKSRFFTVADAGRIRGFKGLRQGIGLDVKPFTVFDYQRDGVLEEEDFDSDAGLDLFYRFSPSVKLSLSFNTDFAETEVDERVVNLTRFPVFFPEKRDFFLEDSGPFVFGGGDDDIIPFFTRRIGIDGDGGEVPLLASAKLTGQTEDYSFGVLGVRTDDEGDLDAQDLSAARVSKNLLEQSDVGVILTRGDPLDAGRDATWGADLNLRTSEFRGNDNLRLSSYLLGTEGDGSDSDGLAYRVQLDYPNDQIEARLTHEVVEEGFDPALGRARRTGIKRYSATFAYRPRLYSKIRQLDFRLNTNLFTDSRNDTKTVDIDLQPLEIEFESGDEIDFVINHRREILDEAFEIAEDIEIEEASYTFTRYELGLETAEKRPVVGSLDFSTGDFFDGLRDDYELGLDLRFGARGELGVDYEINDVRLSDGDFRVHVGRLRANLQFGPKLSWSNFVQWDNQSDRMGWNSRLWWIPRPESEFFLVFNQGWRVDADTFAPESSQLTFKVGYTLRF